MSGDCSDGVVSTLRFLWFFLLCNSWSLPWTCSGCAALCQTEICWELSGGEESRHINHQRWWKRVGKTTLPSVTLTSAREEQEKWEDSEMQRWLTDTHSMSFSSWQRDPSGSIKAFVYQCCQYFRPVPQTWRFQCFKTWSFLFQFSKSVNKLIPFSENEW